MQFLASLRAKRSNLTSLAHAYAAEIASSPFGLLAMTAVVAAGACLVSGPTRADPVADFYNNRTVSLIVGFGVGGDDDLWGRLVGKHIGRHIPGHPTVTVQNLPGAAGLVLMNRLANASPRDGSVIGMVNRGIPFEPLLGGAGTQFDPLAMTYLGSPNRDTTVCAARRDAAVKTMADLFTTELKVGATGSGADTAIYPQFLAALLGMKFNVVKGYSGSRDVTLAIERNEVQGICGYAWTSLQSQAGYLLKENKINILVQTALDPDPELAKMGVPMIWDFVKDKEQHDVLELIFAQQSFGRPFFVPPGVPKDRLAILRTAFDATMKDPGFVAELTKQHLGLSPLTGQRVQQMVDKMFATPKNIQEKAKEALAKE